jgi:hypothetical protein
MGNTASLNSFAVNLPQLTYGDFCPIARRILCPTISDAPRARRPAPQRQSVPLRGKMLEAPLTRSNTMLVLRTREMHRIPSLPRHIKADVGVASALRVATGAGARSRSKPAAAAARPAHSHDPKTFNETFNDFFNARVKAALVG